jgi:glutathione peroxidase
MSLPSLWVASLGGLLAGTLLLSAVNAQADDAKGDHALQFTMTSLAGEQVPLKKYAGKVVLIVNVASECGLTPQYEQLQSLHEKYADKGLAVLGFPCNQFGRQEPGTAAQIQEFCSTQYGVKFPMFAKIDVNGENAAELYKHLKAQATKPKGPGEISWNFEKFLLDRDGKVIARFEPRTQPNSDDVVKAIEAALAQ